MGRLKASDVFGSALVLSIVLPSAVGVLDFNVYKSIPNLAVIIFVIFVRLKSSGIDNYNIFKKLLFWD